MKSDLAATRRWLTVAAFGMLTLLAGAGVTAPSVTAAPTKLAALPVVDMARVDVAAQLEPKCGDTRKLSDNASTKLVQQALTARGYSTTADGWYGSESTSKYIAWQEHLGYNGIDANGLPGSSSLTALGAGRFTLVHKVNIGSRNDNYRGVRVNTRTKMMLQAADNLLPGWNFTLVQGSYRYPNGAPDSMGTHDGGGVVDVSVAGLSSTQRWQEVRALRTVGFAAWLRTPPSFPYHIHAVAIADPDIWQGRPFTANYTNRNQVCDYYRGDAGLKGDGRDNTPAAYRVAFTWWEKFKDL